MMLVPIALAAAGAWTPLFNGKDLTGWTQCNGKASYMVKDKQIVGTTAEGSPNSFLCTDKEYGDFVLELEVQNDPVLNSGVQIRSHRYASDVEVLTKNNDVQRRRQPAGRVYGYQVEIANEKAVASGGVYDEARRGWLDQSMCGAYKDNRWNAYHIEARGASVKTWVNGKACADMADTADLTGFIALQVHSFQGDKPAQVRWRNIRLQDLGKHVWRPVDPSRWKLDGGGKVEPAQGGGVRLTQVAAGKPRRGFLVSDREFGDFTLRLQYRIVKGNSGVLYRMGDLAAREMGYEVEVDPGRDLGGLQEPGKRGWILHTSPRLFQTYYKNGDWNELMIHAAGRRHMVRVNGILTAEFQDDPGRTVGRIALQLNPGQDLEVFYKDLEILEASR
jgi:hypothetical protein